MKDDEQLDKLLNTAISSYAEATPRLGLDSRILRQIAAEKVQLRQRRVLQCFSVITVGSALLLVCMLSIRHNAADNVRTPFLPTIPTTPRSNAPAQIAATQTGQLRVHLPSRPVNRSRNLPKLEHFPSPAPLTSEERALQALAKYYSNKIPAAMTSPSDEIKPIQIAAIQIEPLPDGDPQKGEQ